MWKSNSHTSAKHRHWVEWMKQAGHTETNIPASTLKHEWNKFPHWNVNHLRWIPKLCIEKWIKINVKSDLFPLSTTAVWFSHTEIHVINKPRESSQAISFISLFVYTTVCVWPHKCSTKWLGEETADHLWLCLNI